MSKNSKVFLSAPMSAFSDPSEFTDFRNVVLTVVDSIELNVPRALLYYAGKSSTTLHGFTSPNQAFQTDISALQSSETFILIYPRPIATSALIELGFALSLGLSILLVVKSREDIPYMIRDVDKILENVSFLIVTPEAFVNADRAKELAQRIAETISIE